MKKIIALFMTLAMVFVFVGCSSNDGTASSGISGNESQVSSNESPKYALNPLTGEYTLDKAAVNKRPVGVMINNIRASLPQRGISKADLCYEVLAEGGITRILALFSDVNKIPDLGSLRSARHYYISLAMGHNAIFCHFGGSKYALNYIKDNKLNTINFISTSASYRDPNRRGKYAYEHTAFTDGTRLKKAIDRKGISTSATISNAFNFGDITSTISSGSVANNITVPFSNSTKATFTYDSTTGLYSKGQFNAPQIDESTGKTLTVKNVFVLTTTIKLMDSKNHANYIDVNLNSGNGYYACDGKIVPITWKKGDFEDKLKVYSMDGKELTVSSGKSWVCVTPNAPTYN